MEEKAQGLQNKGGCRIFNVLLDPLPEEWNGYKIDSDFQTGIMISQCMADETLSDREKFFTARSLLFGPEQSCAGATLPDYQETADAICWFMNEYNHDNHIGDKKREVVIMDFDIDQWRIYAAFKNQYGIDLNREKMHWFTFMGLLTSLNECAFTHVMEIRGKETNSKMSQEEKKTIREQQRIFAIKPPKKKMSEKEQRAVDEFMKYAHMKEG